MISQETKDAMAKRANLRCECHRADCRHHRPNKRCPRGLRGIDWYIIQREPNAGEKLWNLVAACRECYVSAKQPHLG